MTTPDARHDHLGLLEEESRRLAVIAANYSPTKQIPSCPGWDLNALIEHVSGAHRWVSHCVRSGLTPQERELPVAPAEVDPLVWFDQSVCLLLASLASVPAEEIVWTPVTGPHPSAWWRRKAAVEAGIHRWDADHATGASPRPLRTDLASSGIAEFVEEFLPLMLQAVDPAPVTSVRLLPDDIDISLDVSLVPAGVSRSTADDPVTELTGTASDLLLWIWNRPVVERITVRGGQSVLEWWKGLAI